MRRRSVSANMEAKECPTMSFTERPISSSAAAFIHRTQPSPLTQKIGSGMRSRGSKRAAGAELGSDGVEIVGESETVEVSDGPSMIDSSSGGSGPALLGMRALQSGTDRPASCPERHSPGDIGRPLKYLRKSCTQSGQRGRSPESVFWLGSGLLPIARPHIGGQHAFAEAERDRRDLEELVVPDPLQALLEGQALDREKM